VHIDILPESCTPRVCRTACTWTSWTRSFSAASGRSARYRATTVAESVPGLARAPARGRFRPSARFRASYARLLLHIPPIPWLLLLLCLRAPPHTHVDSPSRSPSKTSSLRHRLNYATCSAPRSVITPARIHAYARLHGDSTHVLDRRACARASRDHTRKKTAPMITFPSALGVSWLPWLQV
jgi:hypothetical protein